MADLRTQFVRDAVDSVLSQTLPRESVELILVARFKDEILDTHFRSCGAYVIHVEDVALGPKLAAGLSHSKGTIVAFLEDDDIFEPDKLAAIVEHFRKNPKLILVKNAFTLFDEHPGAHPSSGRTGGASSGPTASAGVLIDSHRSHSDLQRLGTLAPESNNSSMSVRRGAVIPWLDELRSVELAVDAFLFFRSLVSPGEILVTPERLTKVRVHGSNASGVDSSSYGRTAEKLKLFSVNAANDTERVATMLRDAAHPAVRDTGEAYLAVQLSLASLRGARTLGRRDSFELLEALLKRRRTFLVTKRRALVAFMGLMTVVPAVTRRLYVATRYVLG